MGFVVSGVTASGLCWSAEVRCDVGERIGSGFTCVEFGQGTGEPCRPAPGVWFLLDLH
jgi:hypothetical protein